MVDKTDITKYNERLTYTAARRVKETGYITGSLQREGPSTVEYGDTGFAIYKKIFHEVKGWFLFMPIHNKYELLYLIGALIIYDEKNLTKPLDRWKLNVCGHENVTDLSDLVSKIASEHNAGLEVELVEEKALYFDPESKKLKPRRDPLDSS